MDELEELRRKAEQLIVKHTKKNHSKLIELVFAGLIGVALGMGAVSLPRISKAQVLLRSNPADCVIHGTTQE